MLSIKKAYEEKRVEAREGQARHELESGLIPAFHMAGALPD